MMDFKNTLYTSMRFDFLYVGRYNFQKGWVYPESYIPYCMVRLIEKGRGLFIIDGEEFEVTEGQVVYIPQGCRLFCETSSEDFQFISIRFRLRAQLDASDFLADYYHIKRVTDTGGDENISTYFCQVISYAREGILRWNLNEATDPALTSGTVNLIVKYDPIIVESYI